MYYEELMIDGVLHWRTAPDGDWTAYSMQEVGRRYLLENKRCNDLQAQLAALTLTWRAERPKEPGWYWWRGEYQDEDKLQVCEVFNAMHDGRQLMSFNSGYFTYLDTIDGHWAGPIVAPREG